jgi:hypothetical protein
VVLGGEGSRPALRVRLNPDGTKLAIARCGETAVRVWNLHLLSKQLAELGLGGFGNFN